MNWYDSVPTFLSAIASIAAAIAAIVSLRISNRSITIAESSALANYHRSASLQYVGVLNELNEESRELSELSYDIWCKWASHIEVKDNYHEGGKNPRPLRHVLTNASEMLAVYGINNNRGGRSASRAILSVIRDGIGEVSDEEYQKLLNKADGEYCDFEATFGSPNKSTHIKNAPAFRWAYYQLHRRVTSDDWQTIWSEAWLKNGWMNKYKNELLRAKPIFENARNSLKEEKSNLAHTSFPLSCNSELYPKYEQLLIILENILKDCNYSNLEMYKDWRFKDELSLLVVSSMALSFFLNRQLDHIYLKATE